jgi:cation:H+ antiporter
MPVNRTAIDILTFIAGFVLLAGGAEFLVRGASRIAARFNVSSAVIGLTIVAFGTSLPELLVSVVANMEGAGGSEIAIGNIVGSNISNLSLILGVAGLLAVIPIDRNLLKREYPLLIATSAIFIIMAWDGEINRIEGILLLCGLFLFSYYTYTSVRSTQHAHATDSLEVVEAIDANIAQPSIHMHRDGLLIAVGLVGLVIGAQLLVTSSESIARAVGVSDLVIGLSLVSLGTGLPELATTVVAVLHNEKGIAFGNVVGSNLFNMLSIGGITALIRPLPVPLHMRLFDFPVMMGITVLVFLLILPTPHRMNRWKGAILVTLYFSYIVALFALNPTVP